MTEDVIEKIQALTFASERFDHSIYEDVAKRARLREIRLIDSTYHAKVGRFLAFEKGDGSDLQQSYLGEPVHSTYSEERGIVAGTYKWTAEVKSGRVKALKIGAEYLVLYNSLSGVPEDYAQLYFKKLARFATYPYFRAHFATLVSASGIMLAPLPSLTERMD